MYPPQPYVRWDTSNKKPIWTHQITRLTSPDSGHTWSILINIRKHQQRLFPQQTPNLSNNISTSSVDHKERNTDQVEPRGKEIMKNRETITQPSLYPTETTRQTAFKLHRVQQINRLVIDHARTSEFLSQHNPIPRTRMERTDNHSKFCSSNLIGRPGIYLEQYTIPQTQTRKQ